MLPSLLLLLLARSADCLSAPEKPLCENSAGKIARPGPPQAIGEELFSAPQAKNFLPTIPCEKTWCPMSFQHLGDDQRSLEARSSRAIIGK
jgi:hypothetical protein